MSLNEKVIIRRRVSLLAGSSLMAASLVATALVGATLAPTAALAGDECTPVAPTLGNGSGAISDDPSLNGTTADSFNCAAATYATGITYSSSGDLTVTKTTATAMTVTANGVNLTGNGADAVTWNSAAGGVTGGANTAGPVIDVTSVSGPINITTGAITANSAGTTHGIRALSTGGGDITISRSSGQVNNNVGGGQAAIEAVTNGGDISITAIGGTQGRLRAILAQTSGAGTISVTTSNAVSASGVDGLAAIETVAVTGATTISIGSGTLASRFVTGGLGPIIRATSASTLGVNVQSVGALNGWVDFSGVTAGGVNFAQTGGFWTMSGQSVFSSVADTLSISSTGNNTLGAGASISLGGGADIFRIISALSATSATIDFGAGADVFDVSGTFTASDAAINFGADADTLNVGGLAVFNNTPIDFGAGADTLYVADLMVWNGVVAISNLEALNNSGAIFLGGGRNQNGTEFTDGVTDDKFVMSSGVFTGSDDSRVFLDANLGLGGTQIGCATLVDADCLDFTGATTAGRTLLTVRDNSFSIGGGTIGSALTIVEGSTAAEHFVLDPNSTYYAETPQGRAIRKPVVAYVLVYDETNHRHVLVGAPTDEPFQVATFSAAAQEAWRATTGSWLTRQADLRATPGGLEASRGVWGRIGGQSGERETAASYSDGGVSLDYDLTHKQKIAYVNFGADMIGGPGWVAGAALGFVRSDVEFDATPTEAALTGFSGGLYASYVSGPLFVDGLFNANILHIKADAPQMGLGLDVPMKFDLKSLGGQIETGWRIPVGEALFVEPLAGVSYVVTRIEDAEVPGGSGLFDFEESKSLRIGGGARLGLDGELMGMTASYSLAGRYWNESEGEGGATITTASGSSAVLADAFTGDFRELIASLNLYSAEGGISGFVNLGGKFGDDYKAFDGSVGVRVRW